MQLQRWWSELWWSMAKEDAAQYQVIKGMDVYEFWRIYEAYDRNLKEKIKAAKYGR